jgi:hypothetical protein
MKSSGIGHRADSFFRWIGVLLAASALATWIVRPPVRITHRLSMVAEDRLDHRLLMPCAWQRARIPTALRFDPPMGGEHGALAYNAQRFLEMNEKRGGPHLGDDLNGIGGGDSDFGDPVRSVADGLVLYAGVPSPGWGGTVVVAHRLAEGRTLHSMHAHLDRIEAGVGDLVARGQVIGTVGSARGLYLAHLHFEMRDSDQVDIGPGYSFHPMNRLDPTATIAALRGAAESDLSPSPMAAVRASRPETR